MNKIDINKKYRTRSGDPARVVCIDAKGGQPIIALVTKRDGYEIVTSHNDDGRYLNGKCESDLDLVELPELEFDWSCLPAWAEWITKSECQRWAWFEKKPWIEHGYYVSEKGDRGFIHSGFLPRYNGSDPAPIFKRPSTEGGEA